MQGSFAPGREELITIDKMEPRDVGNVGVYSREFSGFRHVESHLRSREAMNTARESERLNEILDCLWRDPATATAIAKNSLDRLAWQELCVLAAWDAAATYGPLGGRLQIAETNFSVLDQWGGPTFAGIVVRSFEPQPNELISYTDCQLRSVGKSGFRRNDAPVNHQVSELVVALEQIRDHLDSVLLRSGDERSRGISRLALASGLADDHFRRLAAWYPQLKIDH